MLGEFLTFSFSFFFSFLTASALVIYTYRLLLLALYARPSFRPMSRLKRLSVNVLFFSPSKWPDFSKKRFVRPSRVYVCSLVDTVHYRLISINNPRSLKNDSSSIFHFFFFFTRTYLVTCVRVHARTLLCRKSRCVLTVAVEYSLRFFVNDFKRPLCVLHRRIKYSFS